MFKSLVPLLVVLIQAIVIYQYLYQYYRTLIPMTGIFDLIMALVYNPYLTC